MAKKVQILIIVLVSLFVVLSLISFFQKKPEEKKLIEEPQVSLSLSSSKKEFNQGEEFSVDVLVDTLEFEVDGVDVILNYSPQHLDFERIETLNSVFETFPPQSIDEEKGKISFSALSSPGQTFQGKGKIAMILFQALKPGETEISFDFQANSTLDSNVALYGQGKDILEKVDNLKILIK